MVRNRDNDRIASEVAMTMGFTSLRFWECEIRENLQAVVSAIQRELSDA
jgi:very-short-patch-repair endonuclease